MKNWRLWSLFCLLLLLLSACSLENNDKPMNYEETKDMVTDILQTEDGKKVVKEILQDDKVRVDLIIESDEVKNTIEKAFQSKEGKEMWKNLFSDPTFVESFQAAFAEEQMNLFKNLMNDASFQAQLLDLLQNPEMEKQMTTVLKSQEIRAHLEKVIEETFQNPTVQGQMYKLMQNLKEEGASTDQSGEKKTEPKDREIEQEARDTNKQ